MKIAKQIKKEVPVKIIDDVFSIPGVGYSKYWESLSIEEKVGALAEKLDEVIECLKEQK